MIKKQTALNMLLDEMQANKEHGVFMQLRLIKLAIEDLIAIEKMQIESAFLNGKLSESKREGKSAQQYFNETFNEHKEKNTRSTNN
jgi:hypothetical protein